MSVTIASPDLVRALRAVLPFAAAGNDEDSYHPLFSSVRIEAADGIFTATATDRYTIGHARRPAVGNLPPVLLGWSDARQLIDAMDVPASEDRDSVAISIADDGRVVFDSASVTFRAEPVDAKLPDLASIFDATGTHAGSGLTGPIALNPKLLRRITKAVAAVDLDSEPLRFFFTGPLKPVRIEVSDWLLIAVMPVNVKSHSRVSLAEVPNIPYGLPVAEAVAA